MNRLKSFLYETFFYNQRFILCCLFIIYEKIFERVILIELKKLLEPPQIELELYEELERSYNISMALLIILFSVVYFHNFNSMEISTFDKNIQEQIPAHVAEKHLTHFQKVQLFTHASGFEPVDNKPKALTVTDLNLISKMVVDELLELLVTRVTIDEAKLTLMQHVLQNNYTKIPNKLDNLGIIAEQADAFVDIKYYIDNSAAKNNINLDAVFDVVHQANMNKADPETGKFIKRDDGKIVKPPGWVEPDVRSVIQSQFHNAPYDDFTTP